MLSCTAGAALADLPRISSESQFREIVSGQTLVRPLVKLQVTPNGQITGTGATWKVSGNWQWQDGYFCRSLNWGGDDLGYNCQEVRSNGERIRFQSDRGTGDFADFRLR
ncbi:dihydrodipicolinate reductase [Chachezhania antarctica]|uniref:dihydrodipicolinate reductase n=1 Tax=Chachezhania antarctica TaxID=2340860 RepID=UPI000EAFE83F|nr:dihydrodipicolinate reductase [Chachezhania antarctica]|tara:strand:+ start:3801 stop:4127 length:327 start_codon:yes stop_codon:yes gene_type:complete